MRKMNIVYKNRPVVVTLEEDDDGPYIESSKYTDGSYITWFEEREIFDIFEDKIIQFMHERAIRKNGRTMRRTDE